MGDLVTLEIAEKEVIKAAAIAYIFPPLMMIAGYLLADRLGFSENQSILGSFLGLGLAFWVFFSMTSCLRKKRLKKKSKSFLWKHTTLTKQYFVSVKKAATVCCDSFFFYIIASSTLLIISSFCVSAFSFIFITFS
ncbi:Positive regulator of sigma E activity [Fusobacterium necrophorum subsp. necrophorum]|nr:Positive regulator of sigma E activity [Fusobacterium necrophorum subsp. necrophorum]